MLSFLEVIHFGIFFRESAAVRYCETVQSCVARSLSFTVIFTERMCRLRFGVCFASEPVANSADCRLAKIHVGQRPALRATIHSTVESTTHPSSEAWHKNASCLIFYTFRFISLVSIFHGIPALVGVISSSPAIFDSVIDVAISLPGERCSQKRYTESEDTYSLPPETLRVATVSALRWQLPSFM